MLFARDTWQFINSFAPWFEAFGTIGAVVTALYLARQTDKLRLQVRAGVRILVVQGGGTDHGQELVWVSITNIGRRTAKLTHLFWKPEPWKKNGLIWIAPVNQFSSSFPISLEDGETATYAIEINEFRNLISKSASPIFSGLAGAIRASTLTFCVSTSTGDTFSVRPESDLRKIFRTLGK